MADAVSEPTPAATATKREEQALVIARRRAEEKVPRHRFGLAYLLLAALLGAAVGLFVVFVTNNGDGNGSSWSAWKPSKSGVQGRAEIADRIGHQYALPNGRQLVGILSEPPQVSSSGQPVPVAAIGLRTGLAGETNQDLTVERANNSWAYVLCGFGTNCAISEGTPTTERYDLLRREALELSLYTMKYDHDVQSVLTFMPPGKAQNANGAATSSLVFLRRADVKSALDAPLSATLTQPKVNLKPGQMSAKELGLVRQLTEGHVYNYDFQPLQDGSAAMILTPIKA
jgi:hypothetical protein